MAEKVRYPQIPSTVWWGIRSILVKSPRVTIDEKLLGTQLDVQETAAKAYINELKTVGLLSEEGRATALAEKWRLDDSYPEAVEQLLSTIYPEGLLHLAPAAEGDRQKIVSWFLREGLGQGAAGNKAATYLLIGSPTPSEPPSKNNSKGSIGSPKPTTRTQNAGPKTEAKSGAARSNADEIRQPAATRTGQFEMLPLNVNVQIHISADAGSEQIESIFSAMRRYLYDAPDN